MPTPREASIWGKIRTELNQAQQNILSGRYDQAVILDREILKRIVRMQIDRAVLVSNDLERDIEQLFDNQLIAQKTRDRYRQICRYADTAEQGAAATAQEANASYSLLKEALSEYMDASAQRGAGASSYSSSHSAERFTSRYSGPSASSEELPENETGEAAAAGSAAAKVRRSYDASGVDIPLRGTPRRAGSNVRRVSRTKDERPARPLKASERVSTRNGRRSAGSTSSARRSAGRTRTRNSSSEQPMEIDLYSILKIAIPVVCLILLVVLIRLLMSGSSAPVIETTPAATEVVTEAVVETEPETTEPETTAPPETEAPMYIVTTDGARVRSASNTDSQILAQLDAGTQVTYKGEADGWTNIDYDGQDGYIRSDLIQPVASENNSAQ